MTQPTDLTMALRELDVIATLADDITTTDYDRPSNLPDWTVEQLVRHIVSVAFRQAEAFHRACLTITEAPAEATLTAPREQLASTLRSALAHITSGSNALDTASDPVVPLPYAALPVSLAGFVLLVEYGIHRYDIEQTVTGAGTLADEVAGAIADRLDLILSTLASTEAPPVTSIQLEPDGLPAKPLVWQSGKWESAANDGQTPECVVRGPADAMVLFAFGRVPATDDRLAIDDPTGALGQFKTMFPGP